MSELLSNRWPDNSDNDLCWFAMNAPFRRELDAQKLLDEMSIESFIPMAYKVIMRNRFMFIKDNLHPVMENIVLLHELGHDTLHREEATRTGGFEEFNIFEMQDNRMEYEANIFASQLALPDDDFLELAERGYDTQQIARTLNSDINLVALKADTLISQGYRLRPQEHRSDFLKYNQ